MSEINNINNSPDVSPQQVQIKLIEASEEIQKDCTVELLDETIELLHLGNIIDTSA